MRRLRTMKVAAVGTALALTAACGGGGATQEGSGNGDGQFVIGVSNTLAGNGWREQMVCSIKAEALASGQVSEVVVISENAGPTEQVQHLQNLISQGVDAIVVNPSDPEQLNGIIEQADAQGIAVVSVDSAVSTDAAHVVTNDQVEWGRLGMEWLAEEVGGQGELLYVRGIEGVQADVDRHKGVMAALEEYPDITLRTVWSGWDYTKAGEQAVQQFSAGDFAGVWTTGADYTVVNAIQSAGKEAVPVTGQDTNAFLGQLIEGAPGAVVTNPAVIGAVGTDIALKVLNGEDVTRETTLTPELWSMEEDTQRMTEAYDPQRPPTSSAAVDIDYPLQMTKEQLYACTGPGE